MKNTGFATVCRINAFKNIFENYSTIWDLYEYIHFPLLFSNSYFSTLALGETPTVPTSMDEALECDEHLQKAYSPMDFADEGIEALESDEHSMKAESLMNVTDDRIDI